MKLDEFHRLIARHGGLSGDPVALDPEVDAKDRYGRTSKGPNPTPKYKYVFADGTTLTAVTQSGGDLQVVDPGSAMKDDTAADRPKPMSEYEAAQVQRQKDQDARANRTEDRQTATARVAEGRADRAEKGRQVLATLQAQQKQGEINDKQAQAAWDKWKFENYDLPRQQRADALAERSANRADQREDRVASTQQYTAGQTAGRDAVDRATAAHDARQLSAYNQARGAGRSPQQSMTAATALEPPDFDAIAERAAQRAIAQLQGLGAPPPAQAGPTPAGDGLPAQFTPPAPAMAGPVAQPGGTGMVGSFRQ